MIDVLKKDQELWSLFTRQEEYNPRFLDKHDRFLHYMSANKDILNPRVSRFLIDHGLRPEYGDGHEFAVCLTHDVDIICPSWANIAQDVLNSVMNLNFTKPFTLPLTKISKDRNPYWNFQDIMRLEEKYGATSTFFIMTARRGPYNQLYRIADLKAELRDIIRRGWDIGLHGGYQTYNDPASIIEEKRILEQSAGKQITGYRNHYLRFKVPDTWRFLEQAGFKYDSTIGYANHIGFRNGMCHPYQPYDLVENRPIDLVEMPLAVQDGTLSNYMHLDYGPSWDLIKELVDTVEKCRGILTLSWHTDSMLSGKNFEFYEKILKHCREKNALITNADDLCQYVIGMAGQAVNV